MLKPFSPLFTLCTVAGSLCCCSDAGPSPAKTPLQELSTFEIEPGLTIQLVAAEPLVQDPVALTFDADGRLWVVEMRGFMPDINGNGEEKRVGRVSVLEDRDGDGQAETSTIYIDSLIMPRALAVVPGGALIVENQALWLTRDTDNDLKADSRELIDPDYAGSPLPEHSGNGLWRGIDNWYYNAKSRFRYKPDHGKWKRDSTEFRGQWGISHDDKGRLYYNYNWSQLHADLVPPNYLSRNPHHDPTSGIDHGLTLDRRVYPIRPNPAVNRGYIPGTLDGNGRLLEFTAACSPLFYRGKGLPEKYYGNAFVCEPSGNLIKRNIIIEDGIMLGARDPHPGSEFMASSDERFRPVFLASGPDGALYIADMYRGLVQHGAHVTPYLREQTLERKLVQPIHRGRIWRIVPTNWSPGKTKVLSHATPDELLVELSSEDGWHRDMAQKLLVERNDVDVVESLSNLAAHGGSPLGRFHALWTLEGLDALTPDLLFDALDDENMQVRTSALRLLEPFAQLNERVRTRLENKIRLRLDSALPSEVLQITLTSAVLSTKTSLHLLDRILQRYDTSSVIRDAVMSSLKDSESAFMNQLVASGRWRAHKAEREIFFETLTAAIMRKGDPRELESLLKRLDVQEAYFGWQEKAILTGMVVQANAGNLPVVKLASAPGLFARATHWADSARVSILASMFEWPGHAAVRKDESADLDEKARQQFAAGRQHYLTTCAGCHGTNGGGLARFGPPLIGSDWVLGDSRRLALIILHGMEGPIEVKGKRYDQPEILPVMPAHSTLDDGAITAIMVYIRNEWGNAAGPLARGVVGNTRHTSQGRVVPWTAVELDQHMLELDPER